MSAEHASMTADTSDRQWITNIGTLHAVADHLHGTCRRDHVLRTIQTIARGISGAEAVAVFEVDETHRRLIPVSAAGIDAAAIGPLPIELTGPRAEGVEPVLAWKSRLTMRACIPLRMDRRLVGAVAIFDGHDSGRAAPLYQKLLDVFARHAATAFYCSAVYERVRATLD